MGMPYVMNNPCRAMGITGWVDLRPFVMWCRMELPTVFGDEMSYYETLCKVKEILNGVITDVNLTKEELEKFEKDVKLQFEELKNGTWIEGTIPYLEKLLESYIPVAIFFGLTPDGYFTAYIPDSWDEITFTTAGYDTAIPCDSEYGQLILNY